MMNRLWLCIVTRRKIILNSMRQRNSVQRLSHITIHSQRAESGRNLWVHFQANVMKVIAINVCNSDEITLPFSRSKPGASAVVQLDRPQLPLVLVETIHTILGSATNRHCLQDV